MFEWRLSYCENEKCKKLDIRTAEDILRLGLPVIEANVPGNFELDMMKAGLLPDLYYSDNTMKAEELEAMHVFYFTEFEVSDTESVIRFDGIDTVAQIYVNGKFVCSHDNMFTGFEIAPELNVGRNELLVHIKPAMIEARRYELAPAYSSMRYTFPSLVLRKAAHSFGWDIMPRIVSAGIWKPVTLEKIKPDKIKSVYAATVGTEEGGAHINFHICVQAEGDRITDYSVKIRGVCRDRGFYAEDVLLHTDSLVRVYAKDPYLWYPRPSGDPDLYDTVIELYRKDRLCDVYRFDFGIRTVRLEMKEADPEGEFCFYINGKKTFILGTNWVPLDAFHSRDEERLGRALELLDDIGCNAVRCWGGNVYASDAFYDFCDKKGILVWQDFAMGCGKYPNDERTAKALEEEAVYQIKRLRNHASLILWAGDNECDHAAAYGWNGFRSDPNENILTRNILPRAAAAWDYARPYIPSSPYISEKTYRKDLPLPEDHLWGPRDYFKGDYYKNAACNFASETGYHGFPSVRSLHCFLKEPEKLFDGNGVTTKEYLIHASTPEPDEKTVFGYRIRLAYNQVATLFDRVEPTLEDFVKQSQISQAEAKKYFIERFRTGKWKRTGIIWWNLIDGWPQVSDAVVDYYYRKKLAYGYIKTSQKPVCLMFAEPENGVYPLYGANEFSHAVSAAYTVRDAESSELLISGSAVIPAASTVKLGEAEFADQKRRFLLIEWESDGKKHINHYVTNIKGVDLRWYEKMMDKCGYRFKEE